MYTSSQLNVIGLRSWMRSRLWGPGQLAQASGVDLRTVRRALRGGDVTLATQLALSLAVAHCAPSDTEPVSHL